MGFIRCLSFRIGPFGSLCFWLGFAALCAANGRTSHAEAAAPDALSAGPAPVFVTDAMIERARMRVESGKEPYAETFEYIRKAARNAQERDAEPYQGPDGKGLRRAVKRDGIPALYAAAVYRISGDPAALETARRILLAWADADPPVGTTLSWLPYPGDPETPRTMKEQSCGLTLADVALQFTTVYGLIGRDLTDDARARVRSWFRRLARDLERGHQVWIRRKCFNQPFNNHLGFHMCGKLALGIALGDDEMIARNLSSPKNPRDAVDMINGAVLMPSRGDDQFCPGDDSRVTEPGEMFDRYRIKTSYDGKHGWGLGYSMVALNNLVMAAELARNVAATDLWQHIGPHEQSIRAALEHYAVYYITRDPAARGKYHSNDRLFMGWLTTYEIGAARLPDSRPIRQALRANPRARAEARHNVLQRLPVLLYDSPWWEEGE